MNESNAEQIAPDVANAFESLRQQLESGAKREEKTVTQHCYNCRNDWQRGESDRSLYCPQCQAETLAAKKEAIRFERENDWASLCPKLFQSTDPTKIPSQNAMRQTLDWIYGPTGLVLHGPTGKGKTRTAWLLLKKQFFDGREIVSMDSLSGLKYAALFSDLAVVDRWVEKRISCPILFMDDVFKVKLTESFESVIFGIIDRRTENGLPIIITANDTGDTLSNRMSDDRGKPLIRRLRDYCQPITFE